MHDFDIPSPLSLVARFSLNQQLIHKGKSKKHNIILDSLVPDTSIATNLRLPGEITF